MAVALATGLAACGSPALLDELSPDRTCRRLRVVAPDAATSPAVDSAPAASARPVQARWIVPASSGDRQRLNAWCAHAGPAVIGWHGPSAPRRVDSLLVASWNAHVGGGDLRPLVRDVRQGVLTGGRPVEDFVLLLQEAHREGDAVPDYQAGLPHGSDVAATPTTGARQDVLAHARALGLFVYYVPSMRSGEGREDRGNAILSTLPLRDPLAIELPVARQRRVVATATVEATTSAGRPWQLQLSSVHLENDAEGWASDERARVRQARALLDALPEAGAAVAAGDFNTWANGRDEPVIRLMRDAFPATPVFPPGPTYVRAFGLLRRYLDYMFFRLPPEARARYRRVPRPYNSDHYPLVGWVVFGAAAGPAR